MREVSPGLLEDGPGERRDLPVKALRRQGAQRGDDYGPGMSPGAVPSLGSPPLGRAGVPGGGSLGLPPWAGRPRCCGAAGAPPPCRPYARGGGRPTGGSRDRRAGPLVLPPRGSPRIHAAGDSAESAPSSAARPSAFAANLATASLRTPRVQRGVPTWPAARQRPLPTTRAAWPVCGRTPAMGGVATLAGQCSPSLEPTG
eukprot:15470319-Alexandrium_andersonii.AAC.1